MVGIIPLISHVPANAPTINKISIELVVDFTFSATSSTICSNFNSLASYLIEHGADVNAVNNNGTTPLIFAAMYNKINSVKLLLSKEVDVTIKDIEGKTALNYAQQKGFNDIIDLLQK